MGSEVFRLKSLYLGNTVARGAKVTTNNASTTSTIEVDPDIRTFETGANYLVQASLSKNQFKGSGKFKQDSEEVSNFKFIGDKKEVVHGDIIRFDSDERFWAITGISADGNKIYLTDKYQKLNDTDPDEKEGVCTLRKIKKGSVSYEVVKTLQDESGMFFDRDRNAWGFTGVEALTVVSGATGWEKPLEDDNIRFKIFPGASTNSADMMTVNSTEPRKKLVTNSKSPISDLSLDPLPFPHETLKVYWSEEGGELLLKEENKDYVVNYSQEDQYKFPFPAYEERDVAYIKFLDELGKVGGKGASQVEPIDGSFEGIFSIIKKKEIGGGEPLITPISNIIPNSEEIRVNENLLVKDDNYKIDYPGGVVFLSDHYNSEEIIGSIATRKRILWDGMSIIKGAPYSTILDKNELVVDQGFTGVGIENPLYFEDREENHLFPGEGCEIDYTSGALLFNTPLSKDEAVLVSYYVEGKDVEGERISGDNLRLSQYPILNGTVRLTVNWTQQESGGDIKSGSRRLSEGADFEVSYLTGKIRIFDADVLSSSVDSIEAIYTPLSLLHTVIQPSDTSETTYKMTILNDTLEVSDEGSYIFSVTNPAVSRVIEDPFKKSGDPDKFQFSGDLEEVSLSNLRVIEGGDIRLLNTEGYTYDNIERTLTLDNSLNTAVLNRNSIVNVSYSFESEILPYAPIQRLYNVLEEGSNTLLIEGFDRRDIIYPGDVLRIDNMAPEATYYLRVKSVRFADNSTFVEFYGSYPEDIYNPSFYVFDKSVEWTSLPPSTEVNKNISVGNDTVSFRGNTLQLLESVASNHLLMVDGRDIYIVLESRLEAGEVKATIFPSLISNIEDGVAVSELPIYTLGGTDLITKKFVLTDPEESAFKIDYAVPDGFEGNAKIQIDTNRISLLESLGGVLNGDSYDFRYSEYPTIDSLVAAIEDTVSTFNALDGNYPENYKPFKVVNFVKGGGRESLSIQPFEENVYESLPYTVGIIQELYKRKLIRTVLGKDKYTILDVDRSYALKENSLLAYRSNITGESYFHKVLSCEYNEKENKTDITVYPEFNEHTVEPGVWVSKEAEWVSLEHFNQDLIIIDGKESSLSLTTPPGTDVFRSLKALVRGSLIKFKDTDIRHIESVENYVDTNRSNIEIVKVNFNRPLDMELLVMISGASDIAVTEPVFSTLDGSLVIIDGKEDSVSFADPGNDLAYKTRGLIQGSVLKVLNKEFRTIYRVDRYVDEGRDGTEVVRVTFDSPIDTQKLQEVSSSADFSYTLPVFRSVSSGLSFTDVTAENFSLFSPDGLDVSDFLTDMVPGSIIRFNNDLIRAVSSIEKYMDESVYESALMRVYFDVPLNEEELDTLLASPDISYTSYPVQFRSRVDFNDGYSYYLLSGESKLVADEDYAVEGGGLSLTEPLVTDDRFRLNYLGLNAYPEEEGKSITCSCRYFKDLPVGSSVEVYMDFLNRDQFYIQTLTERQFIEIESIPEIGQIVKDKSSGGGSGDEVGGDDLVEVYKGGIENLKYLLRDEEIKKQIYLKIYKWYKDRLRNFASELQLILGFRFGNCQHVIKEDGIFKLADSSVEDHNYTLTTDEEIAQIDNGFSIFFPVGYDGASPKYYDRFGKRQKLNNDVYCYNIEYNKIKVGYVKSANPGWVNNDVNNGMPTVDYRILKGQETNLVANYDVVIRDKDKLFSAKENPYDFLTRVSVGDKIKIDGRKTYYEIEDITKESNIRQLSEDEFKEMAKDWDEDSFVYKQAKNQKRLPYELISLRSGDISTLEKGRYFSERGIPTYKVFFVEENTVLKEDGSYYPAGVYFDTGFTGKLGSNRIYHAYLTLRELQDSLPVDGFRVWIEKSVAQEFPMWDDEGNFGARIVGDEIKGHERGKNKIKKGLPAFLLFAPFLPPGLLALLEPDKLFRMMVDSPDEGTMDVSIKEDAPGVNKELNLKGLNIFEERKVSDTMDALIEGVDQKDPRFGDVADITFEKTYNKDAGSFVEGLVFRGKNRDHWLYPYSSGGNDVIEDYGLIPGRKYKNFYDPDNIFRHLLREKQAWQLLELIDKDLLLFDNKIARCFLDGTLDYSSGSYGISPDGGGLLVDSSRFKGYLLEAIRLVLTRMMAYEIHMNFLTETYGDEYKEYGSVRNILTPDVIEKAFTKPGSTETHEEDKASNEIITSYDNARDALSNYGGFKSITRVYKKLLEFWDKRISKGYKEWSISLERGVLYQRIAREMLNSGPIVLGPVEYPLLRFNLKASPSDFLVENIEIKSTTGFDGLGELRITYDLIHRINPELSELNIERIFSYYRDPIYDNDRDIINDPKHYTLSEFVKNVESFKEKGTEIFSVSLLSPFIALEDIRVLDREGGSYLMDTRNIVKDEGVKAIEDFTLSITGVPDHRLYDSRVLFLDRGFRDSLTTEAAVYRTFPVYVKNGNPRKEALEDSLVHSFENLPVPGEWETRDVFNAISIKSRGTAEFLVTYDNADILVGTEGGESVEKVEYIRSEENDLDLIDFDDGRPPLNEYSAGEDLREILWERDALDVILDGNGEGGKLFKRIVDFLGDEKQEIDSNQGLFALVTLIEGSASLQYRFEERLRSLGEEELIKLYRRLAKIVEEVNITGDPNLAIITPDEYQKLRANVPINRPSTKIVRNIVLLRREAEGGKYILKLDLGKYKKIRDLIEAINNAQWRGEYTNEKGEVVPGAYIFGEDPENSGGHYEATAVGGDWVLDLDTQNLKVSYEPVRKYFRIFSKSDNGGEGKFYRTDEVSLVKGVDGELLNLNGSYTDSKAYIAGWKLQVSRSDFGGSVDLSVVQDNYSVRDTENFAFASSPGRAQELMADSGNFGNSVDITPFHVYCWDEPDEEEGRFFEIKNNWIRFKSLNVDVSIPLASSGERPEGRSIEGETLNELLDRINGQLSGSGSVGSDSNAYFYCNLRWDRDFKRGEDGKISEDGNRGYFEYTYLPDQKTELYKSELDKIYLMRDEVVGLTPTEETEIRINEKSNNPLTPGFNESLPDKLNNTTIEDYPVYRSSSLDIKTNAKVFSVVPNSDFYDFSNLQYRVDDVGKTLSFTGNYTTELTYQQDFLFNNTSYDTISELVGAINLETIPETGTPMFNAVLALGGDGSSTDLLSGSGSLSVSPVTLEKEVFTTAPAFDLSIIASSGSVTGSAWEVTDVSYSVPSSRDRITLTATVRYSGNIVYPLNISYNTPLYTIEGLVSVINSRRHLNNFSFEPFFIASVIKPAYNTSPALNLTGTSGFEPFGDVMYGKYITEYNFVLNGNFFDIIEDINSKEPFTGLTSKLVHEGYGDLPAELLIPKPDYQEIESYLDLDGDLRPVLALDLLHMEYEDNTGTYGVSSTEFTVTSGETRSSNLDRDLEKFVRNFRGDYDEGLLSINILPLVRRGFGKLGITRTPEVSMYKNKAFKAYFGVMGDIRYFQVSDYDLTILLNSAKKRMSKPWIDYTPEEETVDYFYNKEQQLKNVFMSNLPSRLIAPLQYENVGEDLKREMALEEDGIYNDYPLGLGTENFLRYIKFKRVGQIREGIVNEQLVSNKYLWLYLKFHREIGCDQKVKYLTKKIEEDEEDASNIGGATGV